MNKNNLNSYKLKITTLSPVHIGTGEVYEPTNFVIDKNKLFAFDEVLFYKSLNPMDKKSFDSKLGDWMQIIDFYKSKKNEAKKIAFFEVDVSSRVEVQYNKQTNEDGSKNKNQLQIEKTYKNINNYCPIIPGSSIKGMLDTALKIYPKNGDDNTQRQNLIVSDAILLNGGIEIGYADRRNRNPNKQSKKGIDQIIEVIQPNSEFIFSIRSNKSFKDIKKDIKIYQQKRSNTRYYETENSFVSRVGKNVGMDYNVEVDDVSKLINRDAKPLATHFLYSGKTLSSEQFGWIKIELIDDEIYQNALDEIAHQERNYYISIKTKIAEEKAKKNKEEKDKEEFAKMTPFEQKVKKLKEDYPDKNANASVIVFQALENGDIDDFKLEALEFVKNKMIEEGMWDKPKKKSAYKRTQKIMEMLK